jgi:hypothetical protein
MKDLDLMRQCADAYCPDHDCNHCKLAIDQDEQLAVIDIVMAVMNTVMARELLCPINQNPCMKNCAWYDGVNETCIIRRRQTK